VELWEAAGAQVPVVDVEAAIRAACRRWRVLEIAADPFRWARSLQLLDGEGLPVLEYPQSPGRMTPATARFYQAVVNGQLTNSGESRLARHIGNAVLREDARGARLAKERKDSPRRIDAAWPPSWPTTAPPPWPGSPGTASTSECAYDPWVGCTRG
jgi:phage terminase large subunit-like protein